MQTTVFNRRSVRTALLAGAALGVLAVPTGFAQAQELEEIVVTGSRIRSPNMTSVSPVTAVSEFEIKAQGVTRVEDLVNSLPQAFAAQGGQISNGSTGTATVNLRGLGAERTLVLVDGRRLMPGDPVVPSPDLNFIPTALVERVDVNTGGASAVYGSDAVAGVVNFIMKRDLEGVRADVQHGVYVHNNSNDRAQDVIRNAAANSPVPSNFQLPDDRVFDGEQTDATLAFGVNSGDGKGNVTAYVGYRRVEAVLQADRDYSGCSFTSGEEFGCGGSGTTFPARFGSLIVDPSGPGNTFRPFDSNIDLYNFGPTNYYQRPDERFTIGAFARYEVAPAVELYADLMFMDDRSVYQIAPGGIFAGIFNVNCDNPLMTAEQQAALCGADAGTDENFTGLVARRNIEGGGRQGETRHNSYRIVTGARGDLGDGWDYDAYFQYGVTTYDQAQTAFFMTSKIQNALLATRDANGNIVCQSVLDGTDPACVPYNIFSLGGVTQEALDYLQTPSYNEGRTEQLIASASVSGDLGQYGLASPWHSQGVGVAFGTEYREEKLSFEADYVAAAGLLNGAGGASPPVDGSFDVGEIFAEMRVPLVSAMPFVENLELDLGYRFSDYSSVGSTHTYKIGGEYAPISDVRFRGSYQRAVRAPNVLELFSPQNVVLDGSEDPCAGLADTADNADIISRCMQAFGLTRAEVLAIPEEPGGQYNGLTGGNPDLDPETSDTYSVGVVLQPEFVPGLSMSIDYFNITVDDYISGIGADLIINSCVETLDPFYCSLVVRDENNSIWLSNEGYVVNTTLNTGSLGTTGVDINVDYSIDPEDYGASGFGTFAVNFAGTWLNELTTKPLPDSDEYDCAGYYGNICGTPNPTWRHKARLTWLTPYDGLTLSAQWRHFSGVERDSESSNPQLTGTSPATDRKIKAQDYFDVTAAWTVDEAFTVRVGANNVFDRDPPLVGGSTCPTGPCNGNTFPQVYDALGRYVFVGLTTEF